MRRTSAPALAVLVVLFLAAFAALRARSRFLALEAEAPTARVLAGAHGLSTAEALAVGELLALDPHDGVRWQEACARFAALRAELGDPLAAVALAGHEAAARTALAAAGGDRTAAWAGFRRAPEAVAGQRLLAMRDRFAARAPSRE